MLEPLATSSAPEMPEIDEHPVSARLKISAIVQLRHPITRTRRPGAEISVDVGNISSTTLTAESPSVTLAHCGRPGRAYHAPADTSAGSVAAASCIPFAPSLPAPRRST